MAIYEHGNSRLVHFGFVRDDFRRYKKMEEQEKNKNKPVKKFRCGGVTGTIWENEVDDNGNKFIVYSATILRSYKDKNDEWQETSSFKSNDLPKVNLVASKCFEFTSKLKIE